MIESILVISQSAIVIAVLIYFFYKEQLNTNTDHKNTQLLQKYFEDINTSKDNLQKQMFTDYLKHIAKLETMVLPKPVTSKMVQEVLDRSPEIVENAIEDVDVDDNGVEVLGPDLSKIPFGSNLKVIFEEEGDDQIPTEVI